jgi:hypothetical protein
MTYFSQFPILHAGMSVPLAMLAPFERQALENHQQSLATLAGRGGLDAAETLNVLDGRRWRREGCWSRQPPSVCRQELIERVWKWEHENADGRLVALSRIVRRALASGQLEKLEDARPLLIDDDRPEQAPQGAPRDHHYTGPDGAHMVVRGGSLDDFKRACGLRPDQALRDVPDPPADTTKPEVPR